ncbi:MAG: hypothetical protein H6502_01070 [Candidatus Woesearchaeota archaeon]|nr:MAG: hypothetical protein H6502_01070 [Candidatus Woesearchaeota archaeon]
MVGKRAVAGLGLVLVVLSMIIIAGFVSLVIIRTSGSFQETTIQAGNSVNSNVASHLLVTEITATDGTDSYLEDVQVVAHLTPGSDIMSLSQLTILAGASDASSSYQYAGVDAEAAYSFTGYTIYSDQEFDELHAPFYGTNKVQIGFFAFVNLNVDIDGDGINETARSCRSDVGNLATNPCFGQASRTRWLMINVSSAGIQYVRPVNASGGVRLIGSGGGQFGNFLTNISGYGLISIFGKNNNSNGINANQVHLFRNPYYLANDHDNDQEYEWMGLNESHAIFFFSSDGNVSVQYNSTEGVAVPLGGDISSIGATFDKSRTSFTTLAGDPAGYLETYGLTTAKRTIDAGDTFTVSPPSVGQGTFAVTYAKRGPDYSLGSVHEDDVIKIHFRLPSSIEGGESFDIRLIPRTGTTEEVVVTAPEAINQELEYVWPVKMS